jgi:hypothetical protein
VKNYESSFRKIEVFLGLFFGTFLICAGGVWIRDNGHSLLHLLDTKPQAQRRENYAIPHLSAAYTEALNKAYNAQDWQKNFQAINTRISKINVSPPSIPQIRVPYIPPPPRPIVPMGFRR